MSPGFAKDAFMNTPVSNATPNAASSTESASAPAATEELMRRIEADLVKMLERGAAGKKAASEAPAQQDKAQG